MGTKRLYLIRHAKSSWAEAGISDHDRVLNERGRTDAPGMADRLLQTDIPPTHFIVSTAARTRETFQAIRENLAPDFNDFTFESELYLASAHEILKHINSLPEDIGCAALIGHNPGMSYAASKISSQPINMVTSHVVGMDIHVEDWASISADTGSIVYFDFPKKHTRT